MAVAEGKSIKNSFLALKVWAESDVLLLAMYGPKQVPWPLLTPSCEEV